MDILTLELFDVTVSAALKEINRAVEEHPTLPLRILLGGDQMLHHNILRFLERHGRAPRLRGEGGRWRIEAAGLPVPAPLPASPFAPPPMALTPFPFTVNPPAPAAAPLVPAAPRPRLPILVTRASLGQGNAAVGRRVLLGVLRELEAATPWVCLALEALELLDDPQAMRILAALQAQGTPVRLSRESHPFPAGDSPFEIMEDTHWQRLAGRGEIVIL